MKVPTRNEVNTLLSELRALAPKRPISYGESIQVARMQAAKLREWVQAVDVAEFPLGWLLSQDAVSVSFVPSHELNEESGMTTDLIDGKLRVYINEREPQVRQRFSSLHEWKHVIDFPDAVTLHGGLGAGDDAVKALQIELIANEFAAQVLMPATLVKRIWARTGDIPLAASLFNVSKEAMRTRLVKLGLIDRPTPVNRAYFRAAGLNAARSRHLAPCAA